ncbi:MAG: DNA polymerase III subunit delta [Clostridiales bacterium]|nr:DNA polymerase III subunit delta [Clostridiales bacterium]
MKFEELKSSLKNGCQNLYLMFGNDNYLLTSAVNLVIKYGGIEMPELNLVKFTEGVIDMEDVVRALNTMPVFSEKRAVYLDLRMTKKSEVKNLKVLSEYLDNYNELAVLIVCLGDNDEIDIDKSKFVAVDCNRLDFKIACLKIKATFRQKNITINDDAVELLFNYSVGDMSKILIECDKLASFVTNSIVTINDVKEIVNQSLEYQIFELTESLAKKDSVKAFKILNDLKDKKDEYRNVPSLILAHFRRLFHISLNKDYSNFELSKYLGIKEYAIKMSQKQVALFTKSSLKKINELCAKLDFDLKQSNISIDNMINLIVLSILNI